MSSPVVVNAGEVSGEDRFSRFELISWWDQARLRKAKVLVIGAGALGNEIIKNCALLGIGNVLVADMDRIEGSNLSRSVLYRNHDNHRFKAEVACESARQIYPEMAAQPFIGNIVHDMGMGVYLWADAIIGGLDNREARVAMNQGAALAGKPWIDGAIEVLSGVMRVFHPSQGPCYECTMSDVDWRILESRRSCALLTREQMLEGKVPTTPTISSIIAGFQVQEMVKQLHGLSTMAGHGLTVDGMSGETWRVTYPRKADCMGHETCGRIERLGRGVADIRVGDLLSRVRHALGQEATIGLSRDVIRSLVCDACGSHEECFLSLGKVTQRQAECPSCGAVRRPDTLLTLGLDEELDDRTFEQIGVPPYDVVCGRNGDDAIWYWFDGDAQRTLGNLAH